MTISTSDRRRRWSNVLFWVGWIATFLGLAWTVSGVGFVILFFVPLLFTGAALLVRSLWRVAIALFAWGWWFFGLYSVLT